MRSQSLATVFCLNRKLIERHVVISMSNVTFWSPLWSGRRNQFNPGASALGFCHHLISLFARASTSGGIVRPICFAVLRFITNSNFVGCSTGRSAGLAPFRILST